MITIRFPEGEIKDIEKLLDDENANKKTTVKELIKLGKIYFAINKYQEGKLSIGRAAEIAGLTLSEMIDIFAKFGIKSKLEVMDYLEGSENW